MRMCWSSLAACWPSLVERALELNPKSPPGYAWPAGIAHLLSGRYADANPYFHQLSTQSSLLRFPRLFTAVAFALDGNMVLAERSMEKYRSAGNMGETGPITLYFARSRWPMEGASKELFERGLGLLGVE